MRRFLFRLVKGLLLGTIMSIMAGFFVGIITVNLEHGVEAVKNVSIFFFCVTQIASIMHAFNLMQFDK